MTDRIAPDRLAMMRDAGSLEALPFTHDDRPWIVVAVDPGPTRSALLAFDAASGDPLPCWARILDNHDALNVILEGSRHSALVVEKVESFGMPVGAEVFETVFWTGRFAQAAWPLPTYRVGRRDVKLHLCGQARARDANVRAALLDRYGGKAAAVGTRAAPGPLHGIHGDLWAALAVAVTWTDMLPGERELRRQREPAE